MEHLKRDFRGDSRYTFPEEQRSPVKHRNVIDISSGDESETSAVPKVPAGRSSRPIFVSDGEDDDPAPRAPVQPKYNAAIRPSQPTAQRRDPIIQPGLFAVKKSQAPTAWLTPTANSPAASSSSKQDGALPTEEINIPNFQDDYRVYTSAETEKELRDLMGGTMNQDIEADVDMDEAIVEGFKEGFTLLAHQVVGRKWMAERESGKKAGGILADDMGLGKTIQTLTRIVDGRPHKSDKEEGWSAVTLVVCPLSVIDQWKSEVERMTSLRVMKHQGPSRTADPAQLRKHHVVVTTYDTVKSEYQAYTPAAKDEGQSKLKTKKSKAADVSSDSEDSDDIVTKLKTKKGGKAAAKKDALFRVKYWRVVLDEAHTIKNAKTKGAVACCALEAKYRWCLTGTPMQNDVSDIHSLFKFLRVKPYSDVGRFNLDIGKPISNGRGAGRAMKRLQVVLKSIMLRRRKEDTLNGKALIELPARNLEIVACPFDASEKSFYTALEGKMESTLDKLMADTSKGQGSNYMSVLLLLLRLRQACNHPILVNKDFKKDAEAVESTPAKKDGNEEDDDLIAAFNQLAVIRKCEMCTTVLNASNAGQGEWKNHCVECVPLAEQAKRAELERPSSAKIRMMLKILRDIEKRDPEEKTIIFSQFTRHCASIDVQLPTYSEHR
ncbi:hypothetical protein NMY22_g13094 [Coprinellus aureogranulatus]|nr:hypothetical protein NMY22_g13094 [Coprinellus aureogranulatus]